MSLIPGLGTDSGAALAGDESSDTTQISIAGRTEWRFEVPFGLILRVKIIEGIGEIFGTELPVNVELLFSGVKYSLYAPLEAGCKVEYSVVQNKFSLTDSGHQELSEYNSEETSMSHYINLHLTLEVMRQEADTHNHLNPNDQKMGPRVLIVGGKQSGKTSLAKILCAYAQKMDHTPVLVNLNPQDGVFALPGSLTATAIGDPFDLESVNGWGGSPTSGSAVHNPKQPLVKNYGFTLIEENQKLFNYQSSRLGVAVMSRMTENATLKTSGIVVDTPPLSIKDYGIIEDIISDYEINVLVVIGNERLSIDLRKKLKHKITNNQLQVIKIPKSGGVVELEGSYIRRVQEESIKEYFNGSLRTRLSPYKADLDTGDYVFYVGVQAEDPSLAFLPSADSFTADASDMEEDGNKKSETSLDSYYKPLTELTSSTLENVILAITQVPQHNKLVKDILNSSVLGYAHVSRVDDTKKKMKVLLPVPGAFPRNIAIATNIKYSE